MADSFKKRKLSRQVIDEYALKYTDTTKEHFHSTSYTLANGKEIEFLHATAAISGWPEYHYLLGQTFPFQDRKQSHYEITDLAFTIDKNGNKVLWSKNPSDVSAFVTIANACHFILLQKRAR
jgi:hypothetical protein